MNKCPAFRTMAYCRRYFTENKVEGADFGDNKLADQRRAQKRLVIDLHCSELI